MQPARRETGPAAPTTEPTGQTQDKSTTVLALPDLARRAQHHHAECRRAAGAAIEHAIACGEALIEAKALCGHGEWLPWLSENFPASERTAQGYMRLASNPQRVAHLPVRRALAVLATSRPTPIDLLVPPAGTAYIFDRGGDLLLVEESPVHAGYYHVLRFNAGDGDYSDRPVAPAGLSATVEHFGYVLAGATRTHVAAPTGIMEWA